MTLYIVVLEDRHTDNTIRVYSTLTLANDATEAFKSYYDDSWTERTTFKQPSNWLRDVVSTCEDGPKGHIETCELDAKAML